MRPNSKATAKVHEDSDWVEEPKGNEAIEDDGAEGNSIEVIHGCNGLKPQTCKIQKLTRRLIEPSHLHAPSL
eukprot:4366238-Amphidinium_carterae.1